MGLVSLKNSAAEKLIEKFNSNTAVIAVIGLGYVGLPLVFALYKKFKVIGFDIDQNKIESLKNNHSYIKNFTDLEIVKLNQSGNFQVSCDLNILQQADAILICVPTPLTKNREPDMSYVLKTADTISKILRTNQLIVLESTTYPGTTKELLQPILESTKLKAGQDFFLGYAPEREDPGNKKFTATDIPKVVGADDPISKQLVIALYNQIAPEVVPVSSTATAEAVKILENIFRCVNIALVNELKMIFDKMNINIWEVIEAAKTKPFGFMPFYPSPGLGGHCIPIDPFYLTWKAKEYDVATRFIELAGEINNSMPHYVIAKLRDALDDRFAKVLNGSKILIVGMAYKKNVDDIRESPALAILKALINKKSYVDYFDPYITMIPKMRAYPDLCNIFSINLTIENVQKYDAVIICTDHDNIDYQLLIDNSKLIIDTRNATNNDCNIRNNIVYA
ncbi:MAG: nucleotide sugar dehydrogenase [Gammaproteobacteria bacterium]|jgi:UDP-N-acetyl-D-glucosamine dehydrogenase